MDLGRVEEIANAVLYEGYILYPYRPSSVKNRQRFNWGALFPRAFSEKEKGSEAWQMNTECMAECTPGAALHVRVRFLQICEREIALLNDPQDRLSHDWERRSVRVERAEIGDKLYQAWQEAIERTIDVPEIVVGDAEVVKKQTSYPASEAIEEIRDADGMIRAVMIRKQAALEVGVTISSEALSVAATSRKDAYKIRADVSNESVVEGGSLKDREAALASATVSTHTILGIEKGSFFSVMDPPDDLRQVAAECRNVGTYPVLAGDEAENNILLSSPIILYDYPQIAGESAGDLFDGTEIDEILTLRILTLTDDEKREMRSVDDRARQILERTESMPAEQLAKMHGAIRGLNRKEAATSNGSA